MIAYLRIKTKKRKMDPYVTRIQFQSNSLKQERKIQMQMLYLEFLNINRYKFIQKYNTLFKNT